jgi:hypothetical protein
MSLREIGWGDMDWIDLAQDGEEWRVPVNMLMNSRVFYWHTANVGLSSE